MKSTSEVAKAEFDRDISELTATVNHMEEGAAERESMMAKNAQDALQRSIESARWAQSTTLMHCVTEITQSDSKMIRNHILHK